MPGWWRRAEEVDTRREQIEHELAQVLRVRGVHPIFDEWARWPRFFSVMWEDLRPNVTALGFDLAADHLRTDAVQAAKRLGPLRVQARLGDSQRFQLGGALALYRYLDPKLLLIASAVRLALDDEPFGQGDSQGSAQPTLLGPAPRMPAIELLPDGDAPRPGAPLTDRKLHALLERVRSALALPTLPADFRQLALWPEWLDAAWTQLAPHLATETWHRAVGELRAASHALARSLPHPMYLARARIERLGEDYVAIRGAVARAERQFSSLAIQVAQLSLEFAPADELAESPFPAMPRHARAPRPTLH